MPDTYGEQAPGVSYVYPHGDDCPEGAEAYALCGVSHPVNEDGTLKTDENGELTLEMVCNACGDVLLPVEVPPPPPPVAPPVAPPGAP